MELAATSAEVVSGFIVFRVRYHSPVYVSPVIHELRDLSLLDNPVSQMKVVIADNI